MSGCGRLFLRSLGVLLLLWAGTQLERHQTKFEKVLQTGDTSAFTSSFSTDSSSSVISKTPSHNKQQPVAVEEDANIGQAYAHPPELVPPAKVFAKPRQPKQARGSEKCNCETAKAWDDRCCKRWVIRFHKMGVVLGKVLVRDYHLPAKETEIKGDDYHLDIPKGDFRGVIIARNMINSVISGYLYHKSGKECHLDSVGRPWEPKWWAWRETKWNWEKNFTYPGTYPKRKGRSICKYLEEESEEDGMRVYMEFAMLAYYQQLYKFWERSTQNPYDPYYGRLFFQCFEDYLGDDEIPEVNHTVSLLFPGGNSGVKLPKVAKKRDASLHSTSKNPILRSRLRQLIRKYDKEVFDGVFAKHQAALNCGSLYETKPDITADTCSCATYPDGMRDKCCNRYLVGLHQMGYGLEGKLAKDYHIRAVIKEIKGKDYTLPVQEMDFRAVIITRNMINSLVSGYLYHKSGRECWLDTFGRPWKAQWWAWRENTWDWEQDFTLPGEYPPRKGRSICKYLAEESEEDGMRVYIEFAMIAYYQQLYSIWERATKLPDDPFNGRVFFQCYEDLVNPQTEVAQVSKVIDLLYPDGKSGITLPDAPPSTRKRDPTPSERLSQLVRKLDKQVFGHMLAKHQKAFQCGPPFKS